MSNRYCLGGLGNDELLAATSALVKREQNLLADVLAHLAELDERRLYLELGFPSLFAYCTRSLGMCESSAGRRILAARVCRKYPAAFALAARGELNLSALCALSRHLNAENAAELTALCSRRSRRDIEALLAERFPRPDVRDSVRRIEALSADRFGVHFTADAEFLELFERARGLASHRLPAGDMAQVIKLGLKAFIREAEKERFAVGRKPRRKVEARAAEAHPPGECDSTLAIRHSGIVERAAGAHPPGGRGRHATPKRTRHIPAAVARAVYVRDDGQCSFVSNDGRRCGCTVFLELDHVQPWAAGGASDMANLRLRCHAHNQGAAREYFGARHIAYAIADRRTKSALLRRGRRSSAVFRISPVGPAERRTRRVSL
ncbi:MAG: HNH endonuclease signature motif containing protein [Pseudomonadota bacterium]